MQYRVFAFNSLSNSQTYGKKVLYKIVNIFLFEIKFQNEYIFASIHILIYFCRHIFIFYMLLKMWYDLILIQFNKTI